MPQALAGNERIAAEDNGDVVMPAAKGAPVRQRSLVIRTSCFRLGFLRSRASV